MSAKNSNILRLPVISLVFFFALISTVYAQGWKDQGEIEDAQVVIEKSRDIVLPTAPRNFEKVPPLPSEPTNTQPLTYNFDDINGNLSALSVRPRVLKLKEEPLEKLYKGYARAGFGNYTTPYFEAYLYNKRDKDHLLGIHVRHRSSAQGPVDKGNSGNGISSVDVSGNIYHGPLTLGADAGYDHTYMRFYGYPEGVTVDRDSIKQHFNSFHIHGFINDYGKPGKPGFTLNIGYGGLSDNYKSSESRVNTDLNFSIPVQDNLSFSLYASALFLERKDSTSIFRDLIKFRPMVKYSYQALDIAAGLNTVIQNDTISSRGTVLLYPYLDAEYHLNDKFTGFLKLDGDMEEVSMHTITPENPFILENIPFYNTDKKFGLDWGIKANLGNLAYFKAGFSYASLRDLYYYLNDSANISKFNIIYDRGITNRTDIYGELNLSRSGLYMVNLKGNYYKYNVDQLAEPWHKPSWRVDLTSRYDIDNKIILSGDFYFMGGIKAWDFENGRTITLSPVNDINFTIDYLFSDRFSVFLDFRNLLGNSYETYWRYPSRGLQFMGGLSVNF